MTAIRKYAWPAVASLILLAGAYGVWVRYTLGLGAATHLSDQFPWGLWIGFDILCGVGLAAGGFAVTSCVYILHIEKMRPLCRPAVLTAFLGYLLVILALLIDLGRPWNVWRPIFLWNPSSVMFEVGWCVMLYTTVLALEFSPLLSERLQWTRATRFVKAAIVPLVGLGFLLSTLHQSSLGSLYLLLPTRLHPLWYTPLLPLLFWISALGTGLGMVIFESGMSARAFGRELEFGLLRAVGRWMAFFLTVFLTVRFTDLAGAGRLAFAGNASLPALLFWLENALLLAAILLAVSRAASQRPGALFAASIFSLAGFLANRLNVSTTGMIAPAGAVYFPSFIEVAVTLMIVAIGLIIFSYAARRLPVFPDARHA